MYRGDESTIEELVKSMLEQGNVQGMAGVPIAIPASANQDADSEHYKLLTYGHRTEAIYRAAARFPNNDQIQATIESGLVNSIVLHANTPRDIRTWIKRFANSFNMQGVVTTFAEFLDDVEEANASWLAHTKKQNIKAAQCGRGQFSWRSIMEAFKHGCVCLYANYICLCMEVYMYMHMYTCTCTCIHICSYMLCISACAHVHAHVYVYGSGHVHVHVYV